MAGKNMQVLFANRPVGWVQESDFRIVETDIPEPGAGELLIQNHYLSLDPYMRGRMDDAKSYAAGAQLGQVMVGGTVGRVIRSNHPGFAVGDHVVGALGWQQYGISKGAGLNKVDPDLVPLSTYLGVVGMPGVTAWYGLLHIGQPKAGETVAVAAATGAVGSVVGQLAKMQGCRVVGIAGGPDKCAYAMRELGFDACVDHRADDFYESLKAATPDGVDVYFENVGGAVLDAVLARMNPAGRIPLCGLISQYNSREAYALRNFRMLLTARLKLQGFIISDHLDLWPQALGELGRWVADGRLKYRESVAQGLEHAPKAFIGMLKGENFGKQIVKLC